MFQKTKGCSDFYPLDKQIKDAVLAKLRKTVLRYGFNEVETPAIESLELLTKKQGDEIISQIFVLDKRGTEELGLRFDLTVPATRLFVQRQKELPKPVKWFMIDKSWRYERPQKGRQREFYQLSVELFGVNSIFADAEIINLLIDCFKALGLSKDDFVVKINSRKLMAAAFSFVKEERMPELLSLIDKKNKISEADFRKGVEKLGINASKVLEILNKPLSELEKVNSADKSFEELRLLLKLLPQEFVEFDMSTVRGLSYYTGVVFEAFDRAEKFRSLAGGGRYDNLIAQIGGISTPAVGFGIGYSTVMLLLNEKGCAPLPSKKIDYYVAAVSDDVREEVFRITQNLRNMFVVEMDVAGRSLSKQMSAANQLNAEYVLVIGPDEIKSGKAMAKKLSTGEEKDFDIKKYL